MAIKVTVPNSKTINTSIVSGRGSQKVENLANVDAAGLQDGYTLIYNSETLKWEAVDPSTTVAPSSIDGGTY
jgi:hypothetical protein